MPGCSLGGKKVKLVLRTGHQSTKALILVHSWSLKMPLQPTWLKSTKKCFWFLFCFFFLACMKFLSIFDSSSMNFDNWYAATMLRKKAAGSWAQIWESHSWRGVLVQSSHKKPGGGWGGERGAGVFIILEQLQFRIQTCRGNSQQSPPLNWHIRRCPHISPDAAPSKNETAETRGCRGRIKLPDAAKTNGPSSAQTHSLFFLFFFLKHARQNEQLASSQSIPILQTVAQSQPSGSLRKLTGEDSLPSLAGAHQKVRQRVATVPMEDKPFFFRGRTKRLEKRRARATRREMGEWPRGWIAKGHEYWKSFHLLLCRFWRRNQDWMQLQIQCDVGCTRTSASPVNFHFHSLFCSDASIRNTSDVFSCSSCSV